MKLNGKPKIFGLGIIALLSIVGLILSSSEKMINWFHWYTVEFNMLSYSPWLLPVSWSAWAIYMFITWKKRAYWYYWVVGAVWGVHEILWTYGMLITWYL